MSGERRKSFRVEWGNSAGKIDLGDGRRPRKCIVSNLSDGGAKISGVTAALPDEFRLTLDKKHTFPAVYAGEPTTKSVFHLRASRITCCFLRMPTFRQISKRRNSRLTQPANSTSHDLEPTAASRWELKRAKALGL